MAGALDGCRVVVPESRELDLFVSMLERAGAEALRCPLVAILDLQDPAPAEAWLRRLVDGAFDDVVFYTGEGLRRLLAVAERAGFEAEVRGALRRVRTVVRGPKPARVLREIGLSPGLSADDPTTDGLAATLAAQPMAGRRVGVQLYPGCPDVLETALRRAGAAEVATVLPYRYASREEDDRVAATIRRMAAGEVDLVALTARPQVRRLLDVAKAHGLEDVLAGAARRVGVAAVGPVVAAAAREGGWEVVATPETNFHLKPFVAAMAALMARRRAGAPAPS